jgi:medium-chain acyl-[acyl-carrier-protein] hydrolase
MNTESIQLQQAQPQAHLRLLCFPHAGGGANVFRGWDQALGEDVEVSSVQLPGREWRRNEPLLTRMDAVVEHLLPAVSLWLTDPRPGIFFGYSMGAAVAYSLAARLLREQATQSSVPLPVSIFAAACRGPLKLREMKPLYHLSEAEFVEAIRHFGGMPQAILDEPDLLQLAVPILRADFEVLGTCEWSDCPRLPLPITVYGGTTDPHATRSELAGWRDHTSDEFKLRLFSGGHFFINDARAQLLRTLSADLAQVRTPATAAMTH